jgi:GNAT superfamily N-acetyltransferase
MAGAVAVRAARPDDFGAILLMIDELHAAEWAHLPLSRVKVLYELDACLAEGIVLVGTVDEVVAGVLAIRLASYWFSEAMLLADKLFYVAPAFRRHRLAPKLIGEAKAFADEVRLPLYIVNSSNTGTNRKDRLYGRYLEPCGHIFRHEPR